MLEDLLEGWRFRFGIVATVSELRDEVLSLQAQAKNGTDDSANQNPSTQAPVTQAPAANAPSAQAGSAKTRNHNSKALPPAPAKPASDLVDVRRNLLSI